MEIRTLDFVDWEDFLERKDRLAFFTLDFEIDAGFSFSSAVASRKIEKGAGLYSVDKAVELSKVKLKLNYLIKKAEIEVREVEILSVPGRSYDSTERYFISATFALVDLDYDVLIGRVAEACLKVSSLPRKIQLAVFFNDFLGSKSHYIRDEILSHIELSGFYARQVPATLNLYLNESKDVYFRAFQEGGGHNSSGQNPVHPLHVRSKEIISAYEENIKIPENIRKHYRKGIRYGFLEFYDESFLCFYKIIESIFKQDKFAKKIADKILNNNSKEVVGAIKSSNQKTMMLFIYQFIVAVDTQISCDEKNKLMANMLAASELRNSIAHSSDQSEKSRNILPFLIFLSKFMIKNRD